MNARFGIIAGLTIALYACKGDTDEGLFLTDTSAALDCGPAGSSACTFTSSSQPSAPKPDDSYHSDDDGYDDDDYDHHGGAPDAGAACDYDDDCAPGESCERQHGTSHCAPDDDHGYSGSGGSHGDDDDHGYSGNGGDDDDSNPGTPDATPPACDDGYDCDHDRSGSNSGPH